MVREQLIESCGCEAVQQVLTHLLQCQHGDVFAARCLDNRPGIRPTVAAIQGHDRELIWCVLRRVTGMLRTLLQVVLRTVLRLSVAAQHTQGMPVIRQIESDDNDCQNHCQNGQIPVPLCCGKRTAQRAGNPQKMNERNQIGQRHAPFRTRRKESQTRPADDKHQCDGDGYVHCSARN